MTNLKEKARRQPRQDSLSLADAYVGPGGAVETAMGLVEEANAIRQSEKEEK